MVVEVGLEKNITFGRSLVRTVLLGVAVRTRGPLVNLGFPATQVGLKLIDRLDWVNSSKKW